MDPMGDAYYLFDPIGIHRSLCLGIWTSIQGVLCFRPTRLIETQRFRGGFVACGRVASFPTMEYHENTQPPHREND